jgi:predicted CoA-binding protein
MTRSMKNNTIQEFLKQPRLAIIGVSRNPNHFAHRMFITMKGKGYTVYAVNPFTDRIGAEPSFPSVRAVPEKVDGAVVLLPPEKVVSVLQDIVGAGISRVWIQQQSESKEAIQFCTDHHITVISGECLLMYLEPVTGAHRFHRWIRKVTGSLPN